MTRSPSKVFEAWKCWKNHELPQPHKIFPSTYSLPRSGGKIWQGSAIKFLQTFDVPSGGFSPVLFIRSVHIHGHFVKFNSNKNGTHGPYGPSTLLATWLWTRWKIIRFDGCVDHQILRLALSDYSFLFVSDLAVSKCGRSLIFMVCLSRLPGSKTFIRFLWYQGFLISCSCNIIFIFVLLFNVLRSS